VEHGVVAPRVRPPSRAIMELGVPGRSGISPLPPTPYPRWGVRPEE
jgi:hypothetical protein